MAIAREGLREIFMATLLLGGGVALAAFTWWPVCLPFCVLWLFVITFFRDPRRHCRCRPEMLCSPADGTVTEVTDLATYPPLDGPALRIGIFLSIFDVHINRSPSTGVVRSTAYRKGEFLDARHVGSGPRNESNTLVLDPQSPMPGPIIVRQVAGKIARRIICHAQCGTRLAAGERFGLIKFGSRTELIIPRLPETEIKVRVGDKVRAGLTILATQPALSAGAFRADSLLRSPAELAIP